MAQSASLTVGPQGRIVIPAELRRELAIEPGDVLNVSVDDDKLVLESRRAIWRRFRGAGAHLKKPGESVVDELIAERRFEASIEHLPLEEQRARRRARWQVDGRK